MTLLLSHQRVFVVRTKELIKGWRLQIADCEEDKVIEFLRRKEGRNEGEIMQRKEGRKHLGAGKDGTKERRGLWLLRIEEESGFSAWAAGHKSTKSIVDLVGVWLQEFGFMQCRNQEKVAERR